MGIAVQYVLRRRTVAQLLDTVDFSKFLLLRIKQAALFVYSNLPHRKIFDASEMLLGFVETSRRFYSRQIPLHYLPIARSSLTLICIVALPTVHWPASLLLKSRQIFFLVPKEGITHGIHNHQGHHWLKYILDLSLWIIESSLCANTIFIFEISTYPYWIFANHAPSNTCFRTL